MINEFNHNSAEKRNEEELRALQESGAHIARARFDSIPDASEFKGRLKAQLMTKRELKRTSMWQKIREGLAHIVPTQKTFVFGMVVVLLVAVVTTMVINHPGGSQTGGTLAELLIDRAYAKDNFEITPTSGDELAVDSTTEFIIKSKTALTKDALLPHIHLLPATDFDLTQVSEHEFRVTPRGTLKEKQVYNIQIDAAYKDENNTTVERDFSFAFQVKNQFKLLSSIPGKSQSGVPLNSGIELTFSSENFSDYEKNFSIEPKTDGKFEVHGRTLVFVPKSLKPSTLYTVTVKKSLSVKGMDPLSNDVVIQFETQPKDAGSYGAYWYINKTKVEFAPTDSIVFSLGNFDGQDEFTIKASAFKSFDLYKKNLLKSVEIPNWAYETNKYFTVPAEDITLARTFTVKPQVASQEQNYLKLLVLPETLPKGDYWVEISTRNQSQHLFLEVTDLTTYLTVTTNKSLVWVNDLSTKAAVQGATVSLVNGESLGTTNHNGVAEFSTDLIHISTTTPPRYDFRHENRRVSDSTIQITRGTESTLLVSYANPYTLLSSSPARDQYILNVSTDRTLYLPNDTIKFWGFVQKRDRSAAPKTLTVGIPNTNNFFYGRSLGDMGFLQSVDVAVDDHGYFRGEIKLSNITPSGYSFVVRDGETEIFNRYLEINQYVKPGYTVSAVSDKHAYFTGENIRLNGDVKFFEGTPVPSYDLNYSDSIGAHNGMVTTDKNGHLDWNFTATVNPPNCEFLSDFNCYTGSDVYQNVMLSNVLPEETPINQNIPYSVYNAKIIGRADSLSKEKTAMTVSSTWNVLDLAPLNNDDYSDDEKMFAAPLSHHHIEGIVFESHYEQRETGQYYDFITKTTQKTYSYDQVTTSTMRISGETDDKGHFNVDVPVIDGRSYQVRLVSRDNEGHEAFVATYFYGGNNYSAGNQMTWYSLRNDDEKTRPEKIASGYKVGDSVHLSMYKNDTLLEDKNARILFTELQNGLQKYIVAQNPQYSFDFSDRDIPNVYVGAVYFDGKVYHDMAEGTFRTNIMFDTSERKLNIKIKTDKTLYKPADTVSITLQTLDKNNKGHAARVNISVIDKAYLALVGEKGAFVGGDVLSSLYMPLSDGTLVTQKSHQGADLGNFAGAEGGGCFLAGTPILLPDGTTKNIEDIVVGDSIRTLATETDNTAVTGRVTKTQNHIVSEYLVINGTLRVTPEHRVLVNGTWTTAGKIRVGDGVRGEYGQNVKVTSIEIKHELVKVYNFAVAQYHTYIAGGIYVHNDKGGAATRSNFPDVAYYNWVDTDTNGNATLTFKLPDSVTGWGVAAEAAATDFYAGVQTSVIDVSLPAFGLFGIPQDLLVGDKPQVTGAGYGSALSPKDTVTLKFMGDLFQSAVSKTVSAFTQVHVPADKAVSQSGKVRMELGSKGGKDAIEKSFTAVNSRVVESAQTVIALQNGQLDLGAAKNSASPVELNFVDAGTGSLYYRISDLAWNSGARLDQKVGTIVAHTWFKEFFTEEELGEPESLIAYVATNGFKLLPYGGAGDFDLSAKVAAVLKDTNSFDKETMRTIFVGKLYDTNANSSELASALWGAAALGEPVLPSIHSLAKNDKIAPQDKIRLALAATELGDSEYARTLYDELLKYAVQTDATAKIVFDKESQNAIIENSALMSVLGARLHESTVDKFDTFVQDEHKEILVNLESLLFVKEKLAQLPHGAGSLDIAIGSQKDTVKVENGLGHTLTLAPVNFNSVQISNLKGPIALVVKYDKPADVSKSSSMVKLTREYFVHGQKVESVKNGEVVEIRLTPVFAKDAPEGQYLVEDSLPSGLKVTSGVENINPWFFSSCVGVLPFEVDGQRIKFMFDKSYFVQQNISSPNKPFEYGCPTKPYLSYTARVSTLGEFRKEGALIESIESNDVKNFSSDTGMIQIGE